MKAVLPTPAQLRAFVAVADHLHFSDAAAALRMSQPAVSAAVAGLEATLGCTLVERSTRHVLLTPAGEAVAERARAVLGTLDDIGRLAAGARRPLTGVLRLGVIPTAAPYLLPGVLRAFARQLPDLEPAVHEEQTEVLLDRLQAGRVDAAVLALPADPARPGSLVELPLYDEDFLLVLPASSPLAGTGPVPLGTLADLDLLLLAEGHCLRDQTLDVCRQVGVQPERGTTAASLATIVQLVAAGLGATLLPATAVPVEAQRAELAVLPLAAPVPGRRIGLVHRASSPRSSEFAQLAGVIRQAVGESGLPARPVAP